MPKMTLPPKDVAAWYLSTGLDVFGRCGQCGRTYSDSPAVMPYVAAADDGYQRREHPGWAEAGWLLLLECPHCGGPSYAVSYDTQVAAMGQASPTGWRLW